MTDSDETQQPALSLKSLVDSPTLLLYGGLALLAVFVVARLLYSQFPNLYFVVIPLLCIAMLYMRWTAFGLLIPAVMLAGIVVSAELGFRSLDVSEQLLLGVSVLVAVVCSLRFLTLQRPGFDRVVTERMNFTPLGKSNPWPRRMTFGPGHLCSVLLLAGAGLLASLLCSQFASVTANRRQFADFAWQLHIDVGIIPAAYFAIRILFVLFILLWATREVLSYLDLWRNTDSVSGMLLRSELWRWNGREQRMISKQMRKNDA